MSIHGRIDSSALFVVSGGARGVTAQCAIAMAVRYRCRFVLLGRSAPMDEEPAWAIGCTDEAELKRRFAGTIGERNGQSTPAAIRRTVDALLAAREIAATIWAIVRAGGQAYYLQVDIADAAEVQQRLPPVLRQSGPVTGIIHGAGVLADKPIERKTLADFTSVYGVKVGGLAHLLACVPLEGLAYLILFSSAVGFYGNPGQTDYATANETLNKVAYAVRRAYPRCKVVSLNWGPWDGGMVTPEVKRRLAERGVQLIPVAKGAQALLDTLERQDDAVQLVIGDPFSPVPRPLDGATRVYRLWRRLTLAANPFLRDHQIGGYAVLPFVCAAAWFANACEDLYPGYRACTLDDSRALKGIVFDHSLADSYTLDLQEVRRDAEAGEIVCDGLIWSEGAIGRPRYHFSARTTLRLRSPVAPRYRDVDLAEDASAIDGAVLYRDGILFHGPLFHGVQRVLNCSPSKITAVCRAPAVNEITQGQFPIGAINPYGADAQLQVLLIWTHLNLGMACLPTCGHHSELFCPVPVGTPFYVSVDVRSHNEHLVVADLVAHDHDGFLYTRITGAEFAVSEGLNRIFRESVPQ